MGCSLCGYVQKGRQIHGYGSNQTTRKKQQPRFSPCFHLPGPPILGLPFFDHHRHMSIPSGVTEETKRGEGVLEGLTLVCSEVAQVSAAEKANTLRRGPKKIACYLATGQKPVPPVNIPVPTKIDWVVHLPQNGTIGFDPQPLRDTLDWCVLWCLAMNC